LSHTNVMKNHIDASCKSKLTGYCLHVVSVMLVAVKELSALHDKHLNRPTLDDSVDEETAIEVRTQEITQVQLQQHSHTGHLNCVICCITAL